MFGQSDCTARLIAGDRFEPDVFNLVSSLNPDGLIGLDVGESGAGAGIIRQAARSSADCGRIDFCRQVDRGNKNRQVGRNLMLLPA